MTTSSRMAWRSADSTSTGTVHQYSSKAAGTIAVVIPSARPAA